MVVDLGKPITQKDFAMMGCISEARVSQLVSDGILTSGGTGLEWLNAYFERLREQASGRYTEGPLDLAQERAALARAQREGIEIKNAVLRGEYAAIALLSEVLATASQAVAERFEQLPSQLRKSSPDLPPPAVDQIMATIAAARNEWVRQTVALVSASIATTDDEEAEPELAGMDEDDEPRTH